MKRKLPLCLWTVFVAASLTGAAQAAASPGDFWTMIHNALQTWTLATGEADNSITDNSADNRVEAAPPATAPLQKAPAKDASPQAEAAGCSTVVTNTNDSGAGSLREAINCANTDSAPDTISFDIPGTGVHTISPTSALPAIITPVTIDGYTQGASTPTLTDDAKRNTTQYGSNAVLLVELNGQNAGIAAGLAFSYGSEGSALRGLCINRFYSAGVLISSDVNGATGVTVTGCFIGTDVAGSAALGNGEGVFINGSGNRIGAVGNPNTNIISGNAASGVRIFGGSNNTLQNNVIGMGTANSAALGNGGAGAYIRSTASGNTIGGANFLSRNTISGNTGDGILIEGASNTISNNFIGVDASGKTRRGNGGNGVHVSVSVAGNAIGGAQGTANLIGGNAGDGIRLEGNSLTTPATTQTSIGDNNIGYNPAGSLALGNDGNGISIINSSRNRIIGPTDNTSNGISGGLIRANGGHGISIVSSGSTFAPSTLNVVQSLNIGTNAGNGGDGVRIENSSNNTIGGVIYKQRNKIFNNGGAGINILSGTGNAVQGNGIYNNGALGIDLNGDGVTANDAQDPDGGANGTQNYPVPTDVSGTIISYHFNSTPNTTFNLMIYYSPSRDASGNGEGASRENTAGGALTTDANGDASFTYDFSGTPAGFGGQWISWTATDPNGNTSEFSPAVRAGKAESQTTIATSQNPASFGQNVTFTATVSTNPFGVLPVTDTPTGTVTFYDGASPIGTAPLDANATATLTTNALSIGNHDISAQYNGDAVFSGSTSPILVQAIQGESSCSTVVTTTSDTGAGSLREAIGCANVKPGRQTISFNISGAGPHVISPATPLPIVLEAADIDGYTQSGSTPNTAASGTNAVLKIVISDAATYSGVYTSLLNLQGGGAAGQGSVVRGLVIQRHNANAGVLLGGAGGHVVEGCFIGTNATGTAADAAGGSVRDGIGVLSGNNRVGGSTLASRNLISGQTQGINFHAARSVTESQDDTSIQNNLIGTNAAGTAAIANNDGILLADVNARGTRIRDNVISGNSNAGVNLTPIATPDYAAAITDTELTDNKIGVQADGSAALPNGTGIYVITQIFTDGSAFPLLDDLRIGMPDAGNVISGNTGNGIYALDAFINPQTRRGGITGLSIRGNHIGTNASGTSAIPNGTTATPANGMYLIVFGDVQIGGSGAGEGNTVSGNNGTGINIGAAFSAIVQGNKIGINDAATAALPNTSDGLFASSGDITIGGAGAARNIVAGNGGHGMDLNIEGDVLNNLIGVGGDGSAPIANGGAGIYGENLGPGAISGNVIANNGADGIALVSDFERSQKVLVSQNSIYGNGGLGLDLRDDGVTPNDAQDTDTGALAPEELQNYPVLTSATSSGGSTQISGTLNSVPNTTFRIEFFASASADASGYGEGQTYLGFQNVTTDNSGNATINATLGAALSSAQKIVTATAIDPNNNTSEFSNAITASVAASAGVLQFSSATYSASESGGSATITVTRTGGTSGAVAVQYATSNGTATAGADYTAKSGTLNFANGETSKTFTVPITNDTLDEDDETVNLTLSNPTGGAALGTPSTALLTVVDNDNPPALSISDVSTPEGNSGTKIFAFTVSLSAASGKTVSVHYATANNTALSSSDYQAASGTLTFAPGQTSKTIGVTINGDTAIEPNETFYVDLSTPVSATISKRRGIGTIQNDDAPPAPLPSLAVNDVAQSEGNSGTKTFVFTVTLSAASNKTVIVQYATADGTATTAGND
jgi:hypothetical protein